MAVLPNSLLKDMLDGLNAESQPLNMSVLHLFKNDVAPGANDDVTLFLEADFDGYLPASVTWTDSYVNDDGNREVNAGLFSNVATTDEVPQIIYGWYATETGGDYIASARFDEPQNVVDVDDAVICVPRLVLTGNCPDNIVT